MELVEPIAINTKIKSKKDLKEALQILQTWFSPSFPVGSFSYSHGLEAMINDNLVKSRKTSATTNTISRFAKTSEENKTIENNFTIETTIIFMLSIIHLIWQLFHEHL